MLAMGKGNEQSIFLLYYYLVSNLCYIPAIFIKLFYNIHNT
ncbi:hypothetical protein PROVRUST_07748 [Providencia rustigianii DSM 4541]|uniref:Uncharacterized protein n=1 Tax=Providencia rustigianii DSM 4541 TaxID=500637 RepID=D1P682_9GAMM|nr:hypothetical protein PROVRUST_07748 [Providencia rustigianii DSM 4541]